MVPRRYLILNCIRAASDPRGSYVFEYTVFRLCMLNKINAILLFMLVRYSVIDRESKDLHMLLDLQNSFSYFNELPNNHGK
jgi:hypothetical protein